MLSMNIPTFYVGDMIYDILKVKKKTNIFYHVFKNENASKLLRAPLKKNFNKNYKIRVSSSVVIQDLQEGNQEHLVQFNLCQVLNLFKK